MSAESRKGSDWWIYLIRTKNSALYCGITNDLERRFRMHQKGSGAKALRGKGPLTLVWWSVVNSKSEALKREAQIKKYPKKEKEALVEAFDAMQNFD